MMRKKVKIAKWLIVLRVLCILLAGLMVAAGFTRFFSFNFNWTEAPASCVISIVMGVIWFGLGCYHSFELCSDVSALIILQDAAEKEENK